MATSGGSSTLYYKFIRQWPLTHKRHTCMLNKSSESAIAAMSLLAEIYDGGKTLRTATHIAEERSLQKPFVAKILTTLSQNGLLKSRPGKRGGYYLSREPSEISLMDIVKCFERSMKFNVCPFGSKFCTDNYTCPIHEGVVELSAHLIRFLSETYLSVFKDKPLP